MNFLAHLQLAESHTDSQFGALLGDFCQGIDLNSYPLPVQAAVLRHRQIDKFTDQHQHRRQFLPRFSASRRRFAPVALDVYDDYLLIRHWHKFYPMPAQQRFAQLYVQLTSIFHAAYPIPSALEHTLRLLISHQWFNQYCEQTSIGKVLDRIASRVRFSNQFTGIIEELSVLDHELEQSFLQFYPQLQTYITSLGDELTALQRTRGHAAPP